MSPIKITATRTIGIALGSVSTIFSIVAFLATVAMRFAFGIEESEGAAISLVVVWTMSVAPVLPVLAALLAMETWSGERQSGRIDFLLSVAVREGDFVLGKAVGVWAVMMLSVLFFWISSLSVLMVYAPKLISPVELSSFFPALMMLALQGAVWCAAATMLSALFKHAAAAALASVVILAFLPRAIWFALKAWSGFDRTAFGEMPLDAHVVDVALGALPLGPIAAYVVVTLLLLFITKKCVMSFRFAGNGAKSQKASTMITIALAFMVVVLSVMAASRVEGTIDLPMADHRVPVSIRTRNILSETNGRIGITCFLPRNDARFRQVGHILRALKRESESIGGARIDLRFVDPRWDIGAAERLVNRGVAVGNVVFENWHRLVKIAIDEGCDERVCASAIRRVSSSQRPRKVYWTVGHGEVKYDDYSAFGMSDAARDITHEGFANSVIDLATDGKIPGDCALIVIAGAKDGFSRVEIERLDAYLREGGRLLLMTRSIDESGLASLMATWGLRSTMLVGSGLKTMSGSDVIVDKFAEHPISSTMLGSRIVLERPISFVPSVVAETGTGVDRIGFSAIAECVGSAVVASIERGGGIGSDIAMRPTRIVAVGDPSFVINGQLAARACGNRDFFLNCIAYLSGSDVYGDGGDVAGVLASGMDQQERLKQTIWSAAVIPLSVLLIMVFYVMRKRRRS